MLTLARPDKNGSLTWHLQQLSHLAETPTGCNNPDKSPIIHITSSFAQWRLLTACRELVCFGVWRKTTTPRGGIVFLLTAFFTVQKNKTLGFVWQCFCREWFNSWLPLPVWQRNKRNTARRISGLASKLGGINLSRQGDTLTNSDLSIEQRDFYELPDSRTFFLLFFFNCLWVITFRPQVPLPCLSKQHDYIANWASRGLNP